MSKETGLELRRWGATAAVPEKDKKTPNVTTFS